MKRFILAIILACCALTLAAQEESNRFKVDIKGNKPTISDLVWALISAKDEAGDPVILDEVTGALEDAWIRNRDGLPQLEGVTLTIDQKNGFVLYEHQMDEDLVRAELCYWNEADGRHKLVGYSISGFQNGQYSAGQYDGLTFFRYDTVKKTMDGWWQDTGFEVEYMTDDGAFVSYALPRTGKDIVVTTWYPDGPKQRILKWNGRRFSF